MCKIFKFESKIGCGVILAFAAIIFTLITSIRGCNTDRKLAENEYKRQAMEYRPHIVIDANPNFINGTYKVDTLYPVHDTSVHVIGSIIIEAEFTIRNMGSVKANIKSVIGGDTLSYIDLGRDYLLSGDHPNAIRDNTVNLIKREILPHESFILRYRKKILAPKDNKFCLHIMFLYTNDLNHLFDTYQRIEFSINNELNFKDERLISKGLELAIPADNIIFIDSYPSSEIYSLKDYETIKKNYPVISK